MRPSLLPVRLPELDVGLAPETGRRDLARGGQDMRVIIALMAGSVRPVVRKIHRDVIAVGDLHGVHVRQIDALGVRWACGASAGAGEDGWSGEQTGRRVGPADKTSPAVLEAAGCDAWLDIHFA